MKNEYLLALSIDPLPEGQIYAARESLPLHCTLMHWFELNIMFPIGELEVELRRLVDGLGLQNFTTRRQEMFGPHNDVPVWTLDVNPAVKLLHTRILCLLAAHESQLKELRWVGAGWNPHVTIANGKPSYRSANLVSAHLALIERSIESRVKLVRTVFPLV